MDTTVKLINIHMIRLKLSLLNEGENFVVCILWIGYACDF